MGGLVLEGHLPVVIWRDSIELHRGGGMLGVGTRLNKVST